MLLDVPDQGFHTRFNIIGLLAVVVGELSEAAYSNNDSLHVF